MNFISDIEGAPKPVGAYSPAVRAGDFLFCSGQVGLDPESGKMVDGDVDAQAHQVLKNLGAVLKSEGLGFDSVVMTTIFLSDISYGAAVNRIYSEYVVAGSLPARQTVAVKDLPLGALVEISVIAMVK